MDIQCGVPMCGRSTAFPDANYGPDATQYSSTTSNQSPFPSVGALYYNDAFVCAGALIDSQSFAVPASCFRKYIVTTVQVPLTDSLQNIILFQIHRSPR